MVNSYRYAFAATTSVIPSSGTTADLGTGEIGVFDGTTYTATSGVSAKSIIIAQGVPATLYPQGVAKGNFSLKTDIIKGNAVKSWKRVTGRKGKGIITTMGFDGVDTTKGLTVKEGDSFTFWITLSGAPIDIFWVTLLKLIMPLGQSNLQLFFLVFLIAQIVVVLM